jgi:hypothetical protein
MRCLRVKEQRVQKELGTKYDENVSAIGEI